MSASDGSIALAMRALCDELFDAHQRLDPEAIKRFYAEQPDGVYFWERDLVYDLARVAKTIDAIATSVVSLTLTPADFRAGGSGNLGWFAVTFHADRVLPDGRRFEVDGRLTTIAVKLDGRWQIVHDHASIPMPQKAWE
jgi:ketosteroid isomerase-like protein